MTTQQYHIDGMSCAACSSAVERVTRKLNGVESSNVNLTTNRMVITYDESQVTPEMICEKVSKAGFSASLIVEEEQNKKKEEEEWQQQEEQLEAVKRRVVTAICFAVPLLYISMGHMLPFTLPLPALRNRGPACFFGNRYDSNSLGNQTVPFRKKGFHLSGSSDSM